MAQSEIALLKQRIILEYEAMKRGLNGPASGIAQHAFIDARMHYVDRYHTRLEQLVGEQEATGTIYDLYSQIIG